MHSGLTYLNLSAIGQQAAKRRRSEIWPTCISVQGHSGSNPNNVSDRHTWVSCWHENGRFWTVTITFSERYYTLDVIAEKIYKKNFNRFVTTSENVTAGAKKMTDFSRSLAVVTCFLNFSKIALLSIHRKKEDTFVPNLVRIGRATVEKSESWRKKIILKSKSAEKHNITKILKNCIFAKTEI